MGIHFATASGTFTLDDLDGMSRPVDPPLSTGLPDLDEVTGGLVSGSVWSVSGPKGFGVSALALEVAVKAVIQQRARVLYVCGHLPASVIVQRVAMAVLGRSGRPDQAAMNEAIRSLPPDRLHVMDWIGLPVRGPANDLAWASLAESCRLVVIDTLDEQVMPQPSMVGDPHDRFDKIAVLRDLRMITRGRGISVLLTTRLAPEDFDIHAVRAAWRHHPWHEAVMDAADVHITGVGSGGDDDQLVVENRLGSDCIVRLTRSGLTPSCGRPGVG